VSDPTLPVVKGTLDLLVLKAVEERARHGFEVTEWIERRAEGSLAFDESAIYQALYRLEKKGLVESTWGVTENNRRARYYEISTPGRRHLAKETEALLRYATTLSAILTAPRGTEP
jgi:PadR family transcriptional regulator, regulatory protein PadR